MRLSDNDIRLLAINTGWEVSPCKGFIGPDGWLIPNPITENCVSLWKWYKIWRGFHFIEGSHEEPAPVPAGVRHYFETLYGTSFTIVNKDRLHSCQEGSVVLETTTRCSYWSAGNHILPSPNENGISTCRCGRSFTILEVTEEN